MKIIINKPIYKKDFSNYISKKDIFFQKAAANIYSFINIEVILHKQINNKIKHNYIFE